MLENVKESNAGEDRTTPVISVIKTNGRSSDTTDIALMVSTSSRQEINIWEKTKIIESLMKEVGAAPQLAEEIAASVEKRLIDASLATVTTSIIREFVDLGKKRPGEITYSSSGNGSFVHLGMALLNSMSNTKMIHVPYKGGGPAAVAIASGEVQAMMATVGSVIPHINSNRLRAVAVTADERITQYPQVPTIAEGGIKGYEFTAWIGALAPAATPKPVIDKLNVELHKVLKDRGVAEKLSSQTLDPMFMSAEQFAARLKSDYDKYAKVIKESGARVD